MHEYEKLGLFYLGRRYDLAERRRVDEPVLYDSRDLLTHAVCIGMTGSGKTGLGIAVIEEAAIDGVPVIAIDPKGDLGNLLLTFPSLAPDDFARWVEPPASAAEQAETWRRGLAEWDQDSSRIARLRDAARVAVYTPGNRAGRPLAILGALDPSDAAATASSLLAFAGLDVAPHDREHVLVATILAQPDADATRGWPWLVQQIQKPAFDRVGVLDLETFYPARDRQALALRFNAVLAAPGFDAWLEGDPLTADRLLFTADGRPRVAVVSVAHLADAERMLVVSMVLSEVLRWTRRQSGTSSLRALLYMDEVFGYLPPVANPPSKLPLLTLLKQARAHGVGVMLATQNPVDLDYKALANTGTWFLGRLQTERDKARVLDGVEGLSSSMDRAQLDGTLSALGKRVFLMHNVHRREPVVFETRWTLSYLRGPMTPVELHTFAPAVPAAPAAAAVVTKPVMPAGVAECFLPGARGLLEPVLYGSARVHYADAKRGVDVVTEVHALAPMTAAALTVDWSAATPTDVAPDGLSPSAPPDATYVAPPPAALDAKRYAAWTREFGRWVARSQPLRLFTARAVGLASAPGESERDFRIRVQQAARERRDDMVEQVRQKFATRIARLEEKVRRAEAALAREQQQASQQKVQTAVSMGATLLGALMGRNAISASTLGRATTAARGVSRTQKEQEDVRRAEDALRGATEDAAALQRELEEAVAAAAATADPPVETLEIRPKATGVEVRVVTLAWRARAT